MRRVPLARRNLFQDRRRAALSVGGVAVALVLVLILQGVFAGAMAQVTRYLDRLPADVIVSQEGVRTMHMSSSGLPLDTVDLLRRRLDVAWAEPIRFVTGVIAEPGGRRQLAYVIGYDPADGRAGPRRLVSGDPPGRGEGVLDELAADQLGVAVGDTVSIYGIEVRISGLSDGGTSITNSTIFVRLDDMAAVQPESVSYVMVGAARGTSAEELRDAIADALPAATAQTRAEFERSEARIVSEMSADIMRIMNVIGLGIALAVVALALFTLTLAKIREFGVVKALGATRRSLIATVGRQALWTVVLAVGLAVLITAGAGAAVSRLQPSVEILLVPSDVARTAAAALAVGAVGALLPLRRVLTVDPASAFRRAA